MKTVLEIFLTLGLLAVEFVLIALVVAPRAFARAVRGLMRRARERVRATCSAARMGIHDRFSRLGLRRLA